MRIEEIEALWAADVVIDENKLATEAARIPILHAKYYKTYIREIGVLKNLDGEIKTLEKDKWLYYTGMMTDQELRERNWKPCNLTIVKTEIPRFIDSDKDIIALRLRYSEQDEKVSFLKSIISQINTRNFIIRAMIDFQKFQNGQ